VIGYEGKNLEFQGIPRGTGTKPHNGESIIVSVLSIDKVWGWYFIDKNYFLSSSH